MVSVLRHVERDWHHQPEVTPLCFCAPAPGGRPGHVFSIVLNLTFDPFGLFPSALHSPQVKPTQALGPLSWDPPIWLTLHILVA